MTKIPNYAKRVFKGELFDVYQWNQKLFDGSYKTFEAIKRNASVQVIAVTKNGEFVLLKEEQPHLGKFISLPGGVVDEGEEPLKAAKRELAEETGYVTEDLVLYKKTEFGSKINWDVYYYIAKSCEKKSPTKFDAGEKMETYLVSFEEFLKEIQRDNFRNKWFSDIMFRIEHDEKKLAKFKMMLLSG